MKSRWRRQAFKISGIRSIENDDGVRLCMIPQQLVCLHRTSSDQGGIPVDQINPATNVSIEASLDPSPESYVGKKRSNSCDLVPGVPQSPGNVHGYSRPEAFVVRVHMAKKHEPHFLPRFGCGHGGTAVDSRVEPKYRLN
jgi:hypothetical protein